MRAYQLNFVVAPGDAMTNHMLEIDDWLRNCGFETAMFARYIAPELAGRVRPDHEYLAGPFGAHAPDDLLIYHYGAYGPSARYFQLARGRRVLIYHNITPAHYYRGWSREMELRCEVGRRTLPTLTGCDLALGVSDFNRQELVAAGFPEKRTGVLPLFSRQSHLEALPIDQRLWKELRETGAVNLLTVGRLVPNKAIEDVIRIFYVYHRAINRCSRLYIVGPHHLPEYASALQALAASLGLGDAVQFTSFVSDAELKAYYQAADLYLVASHHEGFCIPLVESMYFGVPILARKAAAVPETLGDAGVLFDRLGYAEAAEMAHLLLTDQELRARVIAKQRERLQAMTPVRVEARFRSILARLGIPVPIDGEGGAVEAAPSDRPSHETRGGT
ncbi:MAG: glycosyltransferase [Anaerolineae bacterium]|nr:glycosyltransferase [Anaerolineae bacterium]